MMFKLMFPVIGPGTYFRSSFSSYIPHSDERSLRHSQTDVRALDTQLTSQPLGPRGDGFPAPIQVRERNSAQSQRLGDTGEEGGGRGLREMPQ